MLGEYQDKVPSLIVRLAAVFSDWGQYALLDHFFQTWFSKRWNARILGGSGLWAVPYLHVLDLVEFFDTILKQNRQWNALQILQASPNGATAVRDIYRVATRCYYGVERPYFYVPRRLAWLGMLLREQVGQLFGRPPFEKAWMASYIDRQLRVDASRTHQLTGWTPEPGRTILARIPVMVDNFCRHPKAWQRKQGRRRQDMP